MDLQIKSFDEKLVFEFFWKFSILECAIKRKGYLKKKEDASPNWDAFSTAIQGKFIYDTNSELFISPPLKQINYLGSLGWREQTKDISESNERFLMRMVRSVRNNLFHGGKYPDGPIEEIERNHRLIKEALGIVKNCLKVIEGLPSFEV